VGLFVASLFEAERDKLNIIGEFTRVPNYYANSAA